MAGSDAVSEAPSTTGAVGSIGTMLSRPPTDVSWAWISIWLPRSVMFLPCPLTASPTTSVPAIV